MLYKSLRRNTITQKIWRNKDAWSGVASMIAGRLRYYFEAGSLSFLCDSGPLRLTWCSFSSTYAAAATPSSSSSPSFRINATAVTWPVTQVMCHVLTGRSWGAAGEEGQEITLRKVHCCSCEPSRVSAWRGAETRESLIISTVRISWFSSSDCSHIIWPFRISTSSTTEKRLDVAAGPGGVKFKPLFIVQKSEFAK